MCVRMRVLKVLRYLTVERSATLRDSFREIPSIPRGTDFDEIRESVESVCDDWNDPERRIPQLVKLSTKHVSPKVRQLALTALLRMLDEHAGEVYRLAGGKEGSASRIIRDTMGSLLKRCKTETDGSATLLLAKCLGQLGAIDPTRLNLSIHPLADSCKELGAVDLAVQLLRTNLVAVHRSASVARDQGGWFILCTVTFHANSAHRCDLLPFINWTFAPETRTNRSRPCFVRVSGAPVFPPRHAPLHVGS